MRWTFMPTAPADAPMTSAISAASMPSRYDTMTCRSTGSSRWIERVQAVQLETTARGLVGRPFAAHRLGREIVERHEPAAPAAPRARDVRGGRVVGHAVDPRPQGAPSLVVVEAAPDREVDVLDQVPLLVGIGLVGPGQPLERLPEPIDGFLIVVVLGGHIPGSLRSAGRFTSLLVELLLLGLGLRQGRHPERGPQLRHSPRDRSARA